MEPIAPPSWEDLPAGVLEIVFSKIDSEHRGDLCLVNSSWRNAINGSFKSLDTKSHCVGDVESLATRFTRLEKLKIYFDDEDILHKISSVKSLTNLHLHRGFGHSSPLRSNGVELLTNLSELKIFEPNEKLEPNFVEMLCSASSLKCFSLNLVKMEDRSIQQLSAMTNLTRFELHHFAMNSVEFLSGLTNLEVLTLENSSRWECSPNIRPLSSLVNLTRLRLKNYRGEGSLDEDSLAKLKNLTWLDMEGGWVDSGDLAVLRGLSKLTHLNLSWNPVTDEGVCFLTGLESLTSLFLGEIRAKNAIQSLAPLTGLEVLHLDEIPIKGTDLVELSNLVGLKEVNVHRSEIERGEWERVSAALPHINFRTYFKGPLFAT